MSWMLTGWAKGASRHGEDQACRVQMTRPDFDLNELVEMQRQASGMYRREYGSWAEEIGGHASNGVTGEKRQLPPGRKLKRQDGYAQDDVTTTQSP